VRHFTGHSLTALYYRGAGVMDIAMIGLGKMGANMTTRLLRGGHRVVAYDLAEKAIQSAEAAGAEGARTLDEVVAKLAPPRVVWVMVPAGDPTESTLNELAARLSAGDTIIDGGNSNYKDTMRRAEMLFEGKGILLVDVGTSGGVWGLSEGYSMMVGGKTEAVERLRPILETLAPGADKGWGHVGPSGAGHFVKMVHNGIEYGMMQAYAEGFEIMKAKEAFGLDLHQVAEIWRYGSVVRSWLLDLTAEALKDDQNLSSIAGWVADSGEGRWTVFEAIDEDVPAPVIALSLMMRLASRQDESYAAKLLAAMRGQFGGHAVREKGE
jgi:6-phosphogluconate dehydrogenase